MRVFVVWTLLVVGCVAPALSAPSQAEPGPPQSAATIDQLFATLSKAGSEAEGEAAAVEIQRRWQKSGSDTVDLLMGWAGQSVAAKDYGRALDFLDAIVTLKPDFAEGWNRRASVFYLQDDYGKALSDLEKVLAIEPRHFTALASLGMILRDIDRNKEALLALRRAVALDPYLDDDVRDAIKELQPSVDGREI